MPRVFAEQGVSMLSAILRSDTAIDASVRIIGSFAKEANNVAKVIIRKLSSLLEPCWNLLEPVGPSKLTVRLLSQAQQNAFTRTY